MELTPRKFVSYLKKQLPQVVLFYGPEYSLIKRALNKLIEVWGAAEGIRDFSGRELNFERFSEEIVSQLLFSSKKMIIVREAFSFFKNLKADEKENLPKVLKSIAKNTSVVFVESSDIDSKYKKNPFVSLINEVGVVVLCRRGEEKEIRAWLKRRLSKYGLDDERFVDFLVDVSGGSFDLLEKELEKLLLGFDRSVISGTKVYSPFHFIDLALKGSEEAFSALEYLFSSGFSPILLLVLFQNIVRKILALKQGFNVNPYDKKRYEQFSNRFTEEELASLLKKLFELELKLKTTGLSPKFLWEDFLFFLILELESAKGSNARQFS